MHTTKEYFIDLHVHSTHSDGVLTPEQLVRKARECGLTTIALADHDAVSGVPDAIAAGQNHGVTVIPAVELSVQYKKWSDVHLLGYGLNVSDADFLRQLSSFQDRRMHRNEEILERVNRRLDRQGKKPVPLNEVLELAGGTVGRPHIARALINHDYAADMEHAFQAYLIPCNVPKLYWPIEDAIREIQRCGGAAVLAHPTSITRDRETLSELISSLKSIGLDGVEVYNNMASADEMRFLTEQARQLGIFVTAGSDFHGIEDGLEMGVGRDGIRFSSGLLPPLIECLASRTPGSEG